MSDVSDKRHMHRRVALAYQERLSAGGCLVRAVGDAQRAADWLMGVVGGAPPRLYSLL